LPNVDFSSSFRISPIERLYKTIGINKTLDLTNQVSNGSIKNVFKQKSSELFIPKNTLKGSNINIDENHILHSKN
jgi:hypothetical protein